MVEGLIAKKYISNYANNVARVWHLQVDLTLGGEGVGEASLDVLVRMGTEGNGELRRFLAVLAGALGATSQGLEHHLGSTLEEITYCFPSSSSTLS